MQCQLTCTLFSPSPFIPAGGLNEFGPLHPSLCEISVPRAIPRGQLPPPPRATTPGTAYESPLICTRMHLPTVAVCVFDSGEGVLAQHMLLIFASLVMDNSEGS